MRFELPRGWWDQVLDGNAYAADLSRLDHMSMAAFRVLVYKEAELREVLVATHKVTPTVVWLQAYGYPHIPSSSRPRLRDMVPAEVRSAPNAQALMARRCDCGQGEMAITHPFTCALWGGPRIMTAAMKSWFAAREPRSSSEQ